ncbi:MAG: serine hydrolase [Acidimicrobiia bacterium]
MEATHRSPHTRGRPAHHRRRLLIAPAVLAALALLAAACNSGGDSDSTGSSDEKSTPADQPGATEEYVYPGATWTEVTPEEADVDPAVLQEMAELAKAAGSTCLVVTRDGELVGEWYWDDTDASTPRELFSATKSITAALVGIAHDRGELDITEPASDYITEWQGTDSEDVTIENLLSNDSGRYWDFTTDYIEMTNADDMTQFAIDLDQQFPPGTEWEYNNAAIQTLDEVLEQATGMNPGEYAQQYLFGPTGMDAEFGYDEVGNAVMYFNVSSNCESLARFGYLWLRDGEWDGEQVVSSEYVEASVTPTPTNSQYGYLIWLNRPGHWVGAGRSDNTKDEGDGIPTEGVPEDIFRVSGLGGQVSVGYPSSGIVFSRMGPTSPTPVPGVPDPVTELQRLAAELPVGN